jgi:His-Xaa-Ser system protein HxsD
VLQENSNFSENAADSCKIVRADLKVFSEGTVLRAAHRLTDHSYVSIERKDDCLLVKLQPLDAREGTGNLEGRFANLLLDEELRERISCETEAERRLIIAHALSKQTDGKPPAGDLLST